MKKNLLNLFLTLILVFISFYLYLTNSIDSVMSKERQEKLFTEMNASEALPSSFYLQYEKLNPNGLKRSYTRSLLSRFSKSLKICACEEIYAHPNYFDNYNRFAPHIFIYEVNSKIGAKKYLDYELQNAEFANGIRGAKEASRKFFNKEIEELNDKEILDLLIIHENPSRYNPIRRK